MPPLPHEENWELCPANAHPNAQALMTEPWYWDCTDEYSPFGNDTGADTLAFYSEQVAAGPGLTGSEFLAALLAGWEMTPHWDAISNESVAAVLVEDSYGIETANDAAVAVAFAQMLIFGCVEAASRARALEAISRTALPALLARGAAMDERLKRLRVMRAHLQVAAAR